MATAVVLATNELYSKLEQTLAAAKKDKPTLYQAIVDAPFKHDREMALLFLGFITFFVLDTKHKVVLAAAATNNEYYQQSIANYDFCLSDYKVPLSSKDNSVVKALTTGAPVSSDNWDSFRRPNIEAGVARLNQATSGIGYTVVHPVEGRIKGALMFNFFQFPEAIGDAQEEFMAHYSRLVSRALS